jgi:enoyl-CoA hydratase/carnithine racemase
VVVLTGRERTFSAGFDLRSDDWPTMLTAGARTAERMPGGRLRRLQDRPMRAHHATKLRIRADALAALADGIDRIANPERGI